MPASRLKILFVSNWLGTGGIETNLILLTRELCARGHEVLVASSGGDLVPSLLEAGGRHHELPFGQRRLLRAATGLAMLVQHEQPDIIHFFSSSTAFAGVIAKLLTRARLSRWPVVVSSVMGLQQDPDEWIGVTYLRVYLTTLGARRTFIIAPAIGQMLRRLPIHRSRLVECPVVGIDRHFADQATPQSVARCKADLAITGRIVSTIGNLAPRKSHELFVQSAAILAPKFPDVTFLIIGEGSMREALERDIERLGLQGRVRLLGQRSDTPVLLAASDVYVKPGIVEGFIGITVLEAQLMARPVVAFDTEDVRLAIDDGKTGLIAERGDIRALSDAIGACLGDPARANRIAQAGHQNVLAKFSMDAIVDQLARQYHSLLARRSHADARP